MQKCIPLPPYSFIPVLAILVSMFFYPSFCITLLTVLVLEPLSPSTVTHYFHSGFRSPVSLSLCALKAYWYWNMKILVKSILKNFESILVHTGLETLPLLFLYLLSLSPIWNLLYPYLLNQFLLILDSDPSSYSLGLLHVPSNLVITFLFLIFFSITFLFFIIHLFLFPSHSCSIFFPIQFYCLSLHSWFIITVSSFILYSSLLPHPSRLFYSVYFILSPKVKKITKISNPNLENFS